jgi:hypothetical protein
VVQAQSGAVTLGFVAWQQLVDQFSMLLIAAD